MTVRLLCALLLAAACTGCGDDPVVTTPTPTSPTISTFSSRLSRGGAVSRSFTTTKAGTVIVSLLNTGSPNTLVGLGLGVPLGGGIAGCTLTTSVTTAGSTVPQFSADTILGTYCVVVYDTGTLIGPIDFDLSITFP